MRSIAAVILLLFSILGCRAPDKGKVTPLHGLAMTMHYRILVGKPLTWNEKRNVKHIIASVFDEINRIYNKWNPRSELTKLNQCKAGQKIRLSQELADFLKRVESFVTLSEGRFDPSIEAVQSLWRKFLEGGKLPSEKELAPQISAVGWNNFHFFDTYFWKDHKQAALDLGGIAKGYAIDLIVERLNHAGYSDVYVEWGGEIRTSGQHPAQRPWRILVNAPQNTELGFAPTVIDMHNSSAASSGDYLQYWNVQGKTYSHIIDPRTCRALEVKKGRITRVTVCASSCTAADAFATAAMLFPTADEANAWFEKLSWKDPELKLQWWIVAR